MLIAITIGYLALLAVVAVLADRAGKPYREARRAEVRTRGRHAAPRKSRWRP